MKLERSKNTARNFIFGSITKVYNLLVPFLMRTAIIYCLGMEYVGLNSLFTSILNVLNLAELGVGSALVFSMYQPLADDDAEKICALMRLYKIYYRMIGLVILVLGLCLIPFLPHLVKRDLPSGVNLYVLYLLNLMTTVLTYWLFAYKNCLLTVHQRNDISDKIGYVINTAKYGIQFAVLYFIRDYYIYVITALVMGVVTNVTTALIVDRIYPQYKPYGKLSKEETKAINQRVRDLFTSKIGGIVSNSADTVVISAFLGLTLLAKYQNYFFILDSVLGFMLIITASSRAGIGNSLIVETAEKNYEDFKKFTLLFAWLGIFASCCFACLYQPFIELWVGKENMLDYSMVITFCIYFFLMNMHTLLCVYKDSSGMWHSDRFRPLITSLANLAMNLITVKFLGLYGVLLSTVLSVLIIGMPWLIRNLFKTIFCRSAKDFIVHLLMYTGLAVVLTAVCIFISHYLTFSSLILTLVSRLAVCAAVPNIALFVFFKNTKEFKGLMQTALVVTNGKLKVLNRLT